MLPIMKLSMRYTDGKSVIKSACKEADALLDLIGRTTLKPTELNHINRMGYQIDFVGDLKSVRTEIGKNNMEGSTVKKEYFDTKDTKK